MEIPELYNNLSIQFFNEYKFVWIISLLVYLLIIFEFEFEMKNKKLLKIIKKSWNCIFFVFSFIGFLNLLKYCLYLYNSYGLLSIIDQNYKIYDYRNNIEISWWCRTFIISKLFELLDTFLIKLSGKKPIFLHWYHHIITLSYSYFLGINYDYSSIGLFLTLINFFVHTIMYLYFTLNDYLTDVSIIKKYSYIITFLQTLQMFIAIFSYVYLSKYLKYKFDYFGFVMYLIYGVLFTRFFLKKIK